MPTPFEEGAKVLDVGCGPGTWLMDIATEYPQVDCLGVDMCDVFPKQIRPPNVRFEVANVTDGLPYPDNTFDFVNVRLLLIGLQSKQWPEMWKEVMRVLKPGGLAQSIEAGMLVSRDTSNLWRERLDLLIILSRASVIAGRNATRQQSWTSM